MSRNLKHYQTLDELVTHGLLTLYCAMQGQQGFWTIKRRNELLVKFIKTRVKLAKFSTCKKDMKTMLSIGRHPKGNLEQKLWDVNQLNLDYQTKFSQADELYIMLTQLFEDFQFPSMLNKKERQREDDTLYMDEKEIEKGFDNENNQIAPLAMTVKTHRLEALIQAGQNNANYRVEVTHVDDEEVIHLLLHRVTKK